MTELREKHSEHPGYTDASTHDQQTLSLLVLDRRPLFRESLARGLAQELADSHVVPSDFAVENATFSEFDLVVVGLPGLRDGTDRNVTRGELERIARISTTVAVTEHEDPDVVRDMIEIGIRAQISMKQSLRSVSEVLRLVHGGGTYFATNAFDQASTKPISKAVNNRQIIDILTPRELDILRLICQGKPNKIIAYELDICDSTVKVHVRHVMGKLGASNRTKVALMAREIFDETY